MKEHRIREGSSIIYGGILHKEVAATVVYHLRALRLMGRYGVQLATPWERARGRTLTWDATCIDTFAPSYIHTTVEEAGLVAKIAEICKRKNYEALAAVHLFTPIAVETSGVFSPETRCFLHKLASRVRLVTNEDLEKSHFYLTQQLAVSIRQGNALSIIGTHVPYGTRMN